MSNEAAMCQGKEKLSRDMATKLALKITKAKLYPYRCKCCRHWHIGNDNKRVIK